MFINKVNVLDPSTTPSSDIPADNDDIIVSVCCITYNHEKYIRAALDGILSQEGNFRLEILIHDDASTDGTADIIREYEEKYDSILPVYQTENQYSKGVRLINHIYNLPRTSGKYIAICDGDDYWDDPHKLQAQIRYMEDHEDCGLVYGRTRVYNEENQQFETELLGSEINSSRSLMFQNVIPSVTTFYRRDLYLRFRSEIDIEQSGWLMGDYPLWIWFELNSRVQMLDDISTVYRQMQGTASRPRAVHKQLLYNIDQIRIRDFMARSYHRVSMPLTLEMMKKIVLIFEFAVQNNQQLRFFDMMIDFKGIYRLLVGALSVLYRLRIDKLLLSRVRNDV